MASLAICEDRPAGPRRPDPRPAVRRLAQVIAEVLTGARPAAQLCDVASPEVTAMLLRSAGRMHGRPGVPVQRPVVSAVHVHEPLPGVTEACALIDLGVRYRAIALRLEAASGRWRCTALSIG